MMFGKFLFCSDKTLHLDASLVCFCNEDIDYKRYVIVLMPIVHMYAVLRRNDDVKEVINCTLLKYEFYRDVLT